MYIPVPPSINDSASSQDALVSEGGETVLQCSATGTPAPAITWKREDGTLLRAGAERGKYMQPVA